MDDELKDLRRRAGLNESTLEEGGMSRLLAHVQNDVPFAMLTACRGEYNAAENNARSVELAKKIRALNLGYKVVDGAYVEDGVGKVTEKTLFVICDKYMAEGDFIKAIKTLGSYYDQDSVLIGTSDGNVKLVATKATSDLGDVGSEQLLGAFTPQKIGDYFSELKGRPFTFRQVSEEYVSKTRTEMGFFAGWTVDVNRSYTVRGRI